LIDRPRRDSRLLQLTDPRGNRSLSLVTKSSSEVVTKLDELVERSRVEAVELGLFVDQEEACL
jgi:hypothetical protein